MEQSGVTGFNEILVLTPRVFEEGLDAVVAVREQRTVLLNLSNMETKLAQLCPFTENSKLPWTLQAFVSCYVPRARPELDDCACEVA